MLRRLLHVRDKRSHSRKRTRPRIRHNNLLHRFTCFWERIRRIYRAGNERIWNKIHKMRGSGGISQQRQEWSHSFFRGPCHSRTQEHGFRSTRPLGGIDPAQHSPLAQRNHGPRTKRLRIRVHKTNNPCGNQHSRGLCLWLIPRTQGYS